MGNGQVPIPQLPQLANIKCMACQAEFIAKVPVPRIINALDFTEIMFVHDNFNKCPNCGTDHVFNIQYVDAEARLGMTYVAIKNNQSAILPGTQTNLSQAVGNDEIAKKIKLQ